MDEYSISVSKLIMTATKVIFLVRYLNFSFLKICSVV